MEKGFSEAVKLLVRYNDSVTRLVRIQLQSKELAERVSTIVWEELYEEQLVFEGLHFRQALIRRIKEVVSGVNWGGDFGKRATM